MTIRLSGVLEMEVEDPIRLEDIDVSCEYGESDGFLSKRPGVRGGFSNRSGATSSTTTAAGIGDCSQFADCIPGACQDGTRFVKKRAKVSALVLLAVVVLCFLFQIDDTVTTDVLKESSDVRQKSPSNNNKHGNSFGGINNIAHPGGAKAAALNQGVAFADIIIPESNVGHAVKSLNRANIINLWGHYVHDEHRSPYASHLYGSKSREELEFEQESYLAKMKNVRLEWGAWNFTDPFEEEREPADFSSSQYKDLPVVNFPPGSWQSDKDYLKAFLAEAKALITRMQKGIYAEYGWPIKEGMTQEELEKHESVWKIHVLEDDEEFQRATTGIAKLSKVAMDGLVRKLLHAMMTQDEFYALLAGHSAAAGHGNNFHQNRIMTFHRIMEPVFDKLGMRLVSRNMGMGGVGTLQFSMGGGDLYGEADILEWDSAMTEKGPAVDLFNKQAILSGERVPVIMTDFHFKIIEETKGTAYMGQYIGDKSIFPQTTLENQDTIPYAAQWFDEMKDKYNAVCWEPRSDFDPPVAQKDHPGSQVGWHPGNRRHTWSGRKLALLVLHALSIALDTWESGIEEEGCPLAEHHWHVGKEYERIRENLRTHITTPKEEGTDDIRSFCENMIKWLPRICRVQLHGYGMWNPRAHVDYDFLNLIHPAPNGYRPDYPIESFYDGFDLLPYKQKLADDQVDVHAIAIATTSPPPDLDHSWIDEDEDDGDSNGGGDVARPGPPPSRRWLRLASEKAMKHGSRVEESKMKDIVPSKDWTMRRLNETDKDAVVPGRGWMVSQK